jgi:hypothetical protein
VERQKNNFLIKFDELGCMKNRAQKRPFPQNGAAGKSGTGSTARFVQNLRDFDDFYDKEALPVVYCI